MKISTITSKAKGFTLIELLVVIAILATLAGVSYPIVMSQIGKARASEARGVCTSIVSGVQKFVDDTNSYPFNTKEARDLGRYNYLLITSEHRDAGLVSYLYGENELKKNYLNVSAADEQGEKGVYAKGKDVELYDPWGRPYYVIVCDEANGGCYDPFTGTCHKNTSCIAFCLGEDGMGEPDFDALSKALGKGKGKSKKGLDWSNVDIKGAKPAGDDDDPTEDNVCSWK